MDSVTIGVVAAAGVTVVAAAGEAAVAGEIAVVVAAAVVADVDAIAAPFPLLANIRARSAKSVVTNNIYC